MIWVQQEFDFGEPSKKNATENPKPALPRFENPRNDNERLLNYQYAAKHGDRTAYGKMYELGRTVALKYINAKAAGNRHVAAMSRAERDEKAHNAITYIVERFLVDSDFCIRKSFTSYLYLRVLHELFYRRKVDGIVDFVDIAERQVICELNEDEEDCYEI